LNLRYFFTHWNVPRGLRFCEDELRAIRARNIFDVLCQNTADLSRLPANPFLMADAQGNEMRSCQDAVDISVLDCQDSKEDNEDAEEDSISEEGSEEENGEVHIDTNGVDVDDLDNDEDDWLNAA